MGAQWVVECSTSRTTLKPQPYDSNQENKSSPPVEGIELYGNGKQRLGILETLSVLVAGVDGHRRAGQRLCAFYRGWAQFLWRAVGARMAYQAVFAYCRGGWVALGPGGLSKDANPMGRAALAATAFGFYLLAFTYDGSLRDVSVHERTAADWTMPTREEFRQAPEQ